MPDLREKYWSIPDAVFEALERHRTQTQAWPHGGFMTAVLENNLSEAFNRADMYSTAAMPDICRYVYNELPAASHGSPEKVAVWIGHARAAKETA